MTTRKIINCNDANLEVQFRMLRGLSSNPNVSQRQLAEDLGISLGSVNFCLQALISKGFVKAKNLQKSKSKSRYLYLLTPQGVSEKSRLTIDFLARKQEEFKRLSHEIENLKEELNVNK